MQKILGKNNLVALQMESLLGATKQFIKETIVGRVLFRLSPCFLMSSFALALSLVSFIIPQLLIWSLSSSARAPLL